MSLVLIGGGSRSGKSRFALQKAQEQEGRLLFIATAEIYDDEMRERAMAHRSDRGARFETLEEPLQVAGQITKQTQFGAIVVDCLTLWLSNWMLLPEPGDLQRESSALLEAAVDCPVPVFLVTNEVGCGIVPENALARRFRDEAGALNQRAASAAESVYWMVFGIPLKVK